MIRDLGWVEPGTTLYIPFHTFDSNDPSASVTLTGLATTDVEIYKDGSVTQRASDAGYALLDTDGIDFDGITGIHGLSIDLADNTTAGFYAAGSQYWVVISSVTVDAATVNFILCTFRIGYQGAQINTTIATLANQTSFTLTSGPAEDDALNGCVVLIHDVASAVQKGFAVISDYTGASKTVTLTAGTTFTAAAADNISVFAPVNANWGGSVAYSATRGLAGTALPNAAADAAGGLPISDAGGLDLDAKVGALTFTVAGDVDVNVQSWGGAAIAAPSVAGVPEVDVTHVGGSAASTVAGAVDANVTHWSGTAVATPTVGGVPEVDLTHVAGATTSVSALATNVASIELRQRGLVMHQGTIGATGNDTTHLHLDGLTQGDDELNDYLIVIFDNSASEYHARWVEDWVLSTELATVSLLPFTPEASVDTYWLMPIRQDVSGGSGLDAAGVRAAVGLAAANLDTQLATITTDTNELQTDWTNGGRLDLLLDATLADTNELQTDWADGGRLDLIVDGILEDTGTTIPALFPANFSTVTIASNAVLAKLGDLAHGGTAATITAERIIVASTTGNEPAFKLTGNGSGAGILSTGGATGDGVKFVGGATSGHGAYYRATANSNGIYTQGAGTGDGAHFEAGASGKGAHVNGTFVVAGATTFTGAVGLSSTLTVTGATTLTGGLTGDITGNLSGSVGSVTTKTGYKLASDGMDLVVPADPSAIPVLGTASIVTWIGWFGAWTVNEVNATATEVQLRNSADNADMATHTVSDDGTTFSSSEPA